MAIASPRGRAAAPSVAPTATATAGATGGGSAAGESRAVPRTREGQAAPGLPASQVSRLRRVKRTVRHIDVGSVFKVSLVLYMSVLIVVIVAGMILWGFASMVGAIHSVEHFVNQMFGFKSFTLAGVQILLVGILVGLVLVVLGSLFNVMCAVLYNLTCDIVGGVRIIEVEEAPGPAATAQR